MEILAVSELGIWGEYILPILLLVLGLSMVIFVHELGHFVVAGAIWGTLGAALGGPFLRYGVWFG